MTKYTDPQLRPAGVYDPYPSHRLEQGSIGHGAEALVATLQSSKRGAVVMDGYVGVLWDELREALDVAFRASHTEVTWVDVREALKPEERINQLLEPFLGGDDPVFGTRFTGELADMFDSHELARLRPSPGGLTVLYGSGAALAGWEGAYNVYVDVPKDTLQYRSRDGVITNLGAREPVDARAMYKRFFFVDWPALNAHKRRLLPRLDLMVDGQDATQPTFMLGDVLRGALRSMSRSHLRARPWFTPGVWGGQWLKEVIPQLDQSAPNYAWSFELIAPENGLTFEAPTGLAAGSTARLEVSFDCLMFEARDAVLGAHAERFDTYFPIRFDYLDTMGGGNLSLQVHPRPDYIREEFGEDITQDETYYLVDCTDDARVYLGFHEGVDEDEFREQLERSARDGTPIDVERYVRTLPSERHGFYLIPHGTVHCSGAGNLVLEISATPYIYTFKMYDWVRLDLSGKPRPINVERGVANLDYSLQGAVVDDELVSRPNLVAEGDGWRRVHLPTHRKHFYDVERVELEPGAAATVLTADSPQVLAVVEGGPVRLRSGSGGERTGDGPTAEAECRFAETYVVPAAAGSFELRNDGDVPTRVVRAFLKPVTPGA